jgi:adenylate cyclase
LVLGPLAALGLVGAAGSLHILLPVLAPLNLWLLWDSFRQHRKAGGLVLAVLSMPFIVAHMLGHYVFRGNEDLLLGLIWAGAVFLIAGILVDWRAQHSPTGHWRACTSPADYWRAVLTGVHPGLRQGRHLFRMLPAEPRCRLCNAPFSGPGAPLMRVLGRGPSSRNPRFCSECLARTPLGGAEIELSLLFADVRGSTGLAEHVSLTEFAGIMNRFYSVGTSALVQTDALVERFQGDEVIGLYVPGFAGPGHARRAVEAAHELLRATGHADREGPWLPVGVGVHTGTAFVGAVGAGGTMTDLTVLGDAANLAARLAACAAPGEVLISEAAYRAAGLALGSPEERRLELKGRTAPADVRVLRLMPAAAGR